MKHYDCIALGTGSALSVVQGLLSENPEAQVAVVDKDEPGGLCLTRACIPSKLLAYPAEVVRQVQEAGEHGIQVEITGVDFQGIMARMRRTVSEESKAIGQSLSASENIACYRQAAEFTGPSSMLVGTEEISADMILLCSGSRPFIPDIPGLEKVGYLTSDTVLELQDLPESLIIAGLETDPRGWLVVNDRMQTSVPNIWAFGDATGQHLFKHEANHEARVVYSNAVLKKDMAVDYHAVPHAVFTHPEIAGVGMKEAEAVAAYGEDGVVIGFHPFQDTARGEAMKVTDCFVKVILEEATDKILGAHIL